MPFQSSVPGDIDTTEAPGTNKKMLVELGIFLLLVLIFLAILAPWATPRLRHAVNHEYYKVIHDEDYGFCLDTENGSNVFRVNRCTNRRCDESFFDETGEVVKAYNYDEGQPSGSQTRFTGCSNTSYFFFEKFAPSGL